MAGIPPALDSDTEDVTWALQTAEALWKRNERSDALIWLRRAAQAAGEAEHDDRALELAHDAAELAEWIADPIAAHGRVGASSERLRAAVPSVMTVEEHELIEEPRPTQPDEIEDVSIEIAVESAPELPEDPEDAAPTPEAAPAAALPAPPVPSVAPAALASPPPPPPTPPPSPTVTPTPAPSAPPPYIPSAAEKHAGLLDPWAEGDARGAHAKSADGDAPTRVRAARILEVDDVITSAPPIQRGSTSSGSIARVALDLSKVEALSDLPDDARQAFARAAVVRAITNEEEIAGFALALIIEGSVYLAATIVDTPAERLEPGQVLRSRGTIEHVAPLRLVAATETARVAVWDEAAVAQAFRTCPWVEDDLRTAGDRYQAVVGVTMGPLGERLDPELRAQVAGRLTVRALAEHEVFAARGKPIPGLLVVGVGELELVGDAGTPEGGALRAGDFLFPNEVLVAAPAPKTVRAARGGALVLFADRRTAQELLVTCPPLLEIFAGA